MMFEHLLCLSQYLCRVYPGSWLPSAETQNVQYLLIFPSPKCILVSFLLLQMLRTRTGWSGSVFAVVLHVGWHQVAEAEHGCVRVLIHSAPGQAEDAFSSSTATGGSHGVFLALSSVTFWSPRDRAVSCHLDCSLEQHSHLQWSEALSLSCQEGRSYIKSKE